MSQSTDYQPSRQCRFESFEQRLVFSGQGLSEFSLQQPVLFGEVTDPLSAAVSSFSGGNVVDNIIRDYGFNGAGQTVVIIDSGIAWDHAALGGGLGQDARVVGGWDFAENDADPYDDGPAGFHGTHVAGIIGSNHETYRGIASGVDLVGLRVFNDAGQGNLQWVEQALQWVRNNRLTFENPITTVNLSLGTSWNADSVPNWGTLEDEFAALRADGIFISVAAGNSFSQYNSTGLSYPAASPHVVPVASHGGSGYLSGFSQRNDRVLVAPGESIISTAPDHFFGGLKTDAFVGASGTSMAAPWVAGASTLLRDAYEFMGRNSINQDLLYNTFRETADRVFDSATSAWYSRVNLESAISSIIVDLHGDTIETATSLGNVSGGVMVEGTIGKVSDIDAFRFTAGRSGRMNIEFSTTHEMQTLFSIAGPQASWSGNTVSFDVIQGQTYHFTVGTADGIGHYRMDCRIDGPVVTNWGSIVDATRDNISVSGKHLFNVQASQTGLFTISGAANSGQVSFRIMDASGQMVHSGNLGNGARVDFATDAGENFTIELAGQGTASLRMANLISLDDGKLAIIGSQGNDRISIETGNQWAIEVNGIAYQFASNSISDVMLNGNGGHDRLDIRLGDGNHQTVLGPTGMSVTSTSMRMVGASFETVTVTAGQGWNQISLIGSDNQDTFAATGLVHQLRGNGFANYSVGFDRIFVNGKGGVDSADLTGSAGNDRIGVGEGWAHIVTPLAVSSIWGFEHVQLDGAGGNDIVNLHGSGGQDTFELGNFRAIASIGSTTITATGIERVSAFGNGGNDRITWSGTSAIDTLTGSATTSSLNGGGFSGYATGMNVTTAFGSSQDRAIVRDSAGNDQIWMHHLQTIIAGGIGQLTINGFGQTTVIATGNGIDSVQMSGTAGGDAIYSDNSGTSVVAAGRMNRAAGFTNLFVDGRGGNDSVTLVGTSQLDRLAATGLAVQLVRGTGNRIEIVSARNIDFHGMGGADEALFSQLGTGDRLTGSGHSAIARIGDQLIQGNGIGFLHGITRTGETAIEGIAAVDYLFMLDGQWQSQ